jgi:hypothetical protein
MDFKKLLPGAVIPVPAMAADALSLKSETRNPKLETRNLKSET